MNILALANRRFEEASLVIILALGISECSHSGSNPPRGETTVEMTAEVLESPAPERATMELKPFARMFHQNRGKQTYRMIFKHIGVPVARRLLIFEFPTIPFAGMREARRCWV